MYELKAKIVGEPLLPLGEFTSIDSAVCFAKAIAAFVDKGNEMSYSVQNGREVYTVGVLPGGWDE